MGNAEKLKYTKVPLSDNVYIKRRFPVKKLIVTINQCQIFEETIRIQVKLVEGNPFHWRCQMIAYVIISGILYNICC